MCGIIAVIRRPSERKPPTGAEIVSLLEAGLARLSDPGPHPTTALAAALVAASEPLEEADGLLRGAPGLRCLLTDATLRATTDRLLAAVHDRLGGLEDRLDAGPATETDVTSEVEAVNAALVRVKDAAWALQHDRLRTAREVTGFAGPDVASAAVEAWLSIQQVLSGIDRLEEIGRAHV